MRDLLFSAISSIQVLLRKARDKEHLRNACQGKEECGKS